MLTFDEAASYPHNVERKAFFAQKGVTQTSPAPRFDRTVTEAGSPASKSGENGNELLKELGLSDEELETLASDGILL